MEQQFAGRESQQLVNLSRIFLWLHQNDDDDMREVCLLWEKTTQTNPLAPTHKYVRTNTNTRQQHKGMLRLKARWRKATLEENITQMC